MKEEKAVSEETLLRRSCDYIPEVKKVGIGYRFWKRFFDILLSLFGIIVLSPLLLLLMLATAISTHWSPIFADKRVGKNGKIIRVLKFRSMIKDAEENPEKYLNEEQMQIWLAQRKIPNDPRITKFGSFLRATSLDELPQLFNIFAGTLSIVGPRPVTEREIEGAYFPEQTAILLSARPGLLGNWGVHGRSKISYASGERQRLELEYFAKRSFGYDTKLLFLAVPAVLNRDGAI